MCCRPTAVVDAEAGVGLLTCLAPDRSFQVIDLPALLPLIAEVTFRPDLSVCH